MPEVKIWEAVALSLDIEPQEVETRRDAWMSGAYPFNEENDFIDRLDVTIANQHDRNYFLTPPVVSSGVDYQNGIRLAEFVRFAIEVAQWDMPDELRTLGEQAVAASDVATGTGVVAASLMSRNEDGVSSLSPKTSATGNGTSDIDARQEATYLTIIGGLLDLMLGKTPTGKAHSVFADQAAIIDALEAHFPHKRGLKKRTLEDKFAKARKLLSQNS